MGLIQNAVDNVGNAVGTVGNSLGGALGTAISSTLSDQWKEYFYCDAMPDDLLMVKAKKRTSSRSSNKGNDEIITNGSVFAVADGQCAIIVDQGKIVEICAIPGEYTYDMSTEPSVFSGNLGSSIIDTFKTIGKRFTFGGDTPTIQRLYYINTKPIKNNLFGTRSPIMFRIVDTNIGLDIDTKIKCNGSYDYIIADPILFYTSLAGNITHEYRRSEIDASLKAAFIDALQTGLSKVSKQGIRYSEITDHKDAIVDAMNEVLAAKWGESKGIKITNVYMNPFTFDEKIEQRINDAQMRAIDRDPGMAATVMLNAQAEAMKLAAGNTATGPMMGFMNMNMAQQMGGMNSQALYQMSAQQQAMQQQAMQQQQAAAQNANAWTCSCGTSNTSKFCMNCGTPKPAPAGEWKCNCGASNTSKFCMNCGAPKPNNDGWSCKCGAVNKGKFCMECGAPKPAGAPLYRCDKCGWEPEDPTHPPKFCPECADPFDENDVK